MKRPRRFVLVLCVVGALLACGLAQADVRLPKVIGDHMVLQQGMPVPIWGWADAGEEVTVTLGGSTATTKACDAGKWMVKVEPVPNSLST